ncbi:hypothetical protein R1flu_014632 [Riccia fluitans]|uniref:Phosphoribosyltransferase domain-containing protein n=1 Tax=Riccia fluitans TaxID=41844 RepID=A0ABD1YH14_9MARC
MILNWIKSTANTDSQSILTVLNSPDLHSNETLRQEITQSAATTRESREAEVFAVQHPNHPDLADPPPTTLVASLTVVFERVCLNRVISDFIDRSPASLVASRASVSDRVNSDRENSDSPSSQNRDLDVRDCSHDSWKECFRVTLYYDDLFYIEFSGEKARGNLKRAYGSAQQCVSCAIESMVWKKNASIVSVSLSEYYGNYILFAQRDVLWSSNEIEKRVEEMAAVITQEFAGKPLAIIGVAFLFMTDLVRKIQLPVIVDFVRMQSYGNRTSSSGVATCVADVRIDVKGKHVLLVEDIVDTGITLSTLVAHFGTKDVASFSVCTPLDKPSRRIVPLQLGAGGKYYRGFQCPDEFVVGYGMDYAEQYL